jgi:hypothetical protein
MKKSILIGLFFFMGIFALSAQNLPSINIVNNTGYDIYYLYVSPSQNEDWGDDVLGDRILEDGGTFTYRLPQSLSNTSEYDFLAEDEDDDILVKMNVTVVNNAKIVFTFDDYDF